MSHEPVTPNPHGRYGPDDYERWLAETGWQDGYFGFRPKFRRTGPVELRQQTYLDAYDAGQTARAKRRKR